MRPPLRCLGLAALALAGCGGDGEPRSVATCGVAAGERVDGPFCLTRDAMIDGLSAGARDVSCRPLDAEGMGRPWPNRLDRCRSGDASFRLAVYDSHNDALRARPSVLEELGIAFPSNRVALSQNGLIVLDEHGADGLRVLRAFERLGEDVT